MTFFCTRCSTWFRCYGLSEWEELGDHRNCGDCDQMLADNRREQERDAWLEERFWATAARLRTLEAV